MKRLNKNIFLISIPIIIGIFVLDSLISYRFELSRKEGKGEYGEYSVWNDIFDGNINSDIIVLGSSRAWMHFNSNMITEMSGVSCYNIGITGQPFLMQKYRYDILRKYNKKPKILIFSLEENSLSRRLNLFNLSQYFPYLVKYKDDLKEPILQFKGFNKYDFELPLVRYYGNFSIIKEFIKNYDNSVRIKGFQGQNKKWNNDLKKAKLKHKSLKVKIDSESLNLFCKLIEDCQNEQIQPILVFSPQSIKGQDFISNRDSIIKMYGDISVKYNIPFIDFSNDSICLDKKYFYNASHLNKIGADKFTKELTLILQNEKLLPKKEKKPNM